MGVWGDGVGRSPNEKNQRFVNEKMISFRFRKSGFTPSEGVGEVSPDEKARSKCQL